MVMFFNYVWYSGTQISERVTRSPKELCPVAKKKNVIKHNDQEQQLGRGLVAFGIKLKRPQNHKA